MNLGIRAAVASDRDWLENAFLGMLRYLDEQEFNILPTEENAAFMVDHVFMPAIIEGRGVFIGTDGQEPIAALFWIIDQSDFEMRVATATSFGQWVEKKYRGQGIVPEMAKHVSEFLKSNGVEQIFDMVHTDEAAEASKQCGFTVNSNIVYLKL